MLTEDRRRAISEMVRSRGSISSRELSAVFDVSPMTIYRDLKSLETEREVHRVRGGAVRVPDSEEPLFTTKTAVNRRQKEAIARYAATEFVAEGDVLILEAGTTVASMVRFLPSTISALAINGLDALIEARKLVPDVTVMGCGGVLRSPSFTFVGPEAEEFFRSISADTAFLSATGLTLAGGITDPNPLEIEVKRAMAASARRTILLLDSSKLGRSSLRPILSFNEIDALVTDEGAPRKMLEELRSRGVAVHVVSAVAASVTDSPSPW